MNELNLTIDYDGYVWPVPCTIEDGYLLGGNERYEVHQPFKSERDAQEHIAAVLDAREKLVLALLPTLPKGAKWGFPTELTPEDLNKIPKIRIYFDRPETPGAYYLLTAPLWFNEVQFGQWPWVGVVPVTVKRQSSAGGKLCWTEWHNEARIGVEERISEGHADQTILEVIALMAAKAWELAGEEETTHAK